MIARTVEVTQGSVETPSVRRLRVQKVPCVLRVGLLVKIQTCLQKYQRPHPFARLSVE